MHQTLLRASRYALPAAFIGYAAMASVTALSRADHIPGWDGLLQGRTTAAIDSVLKTGTPHRDLAIGLIGAARFALVGEGRDGVIAGHDRWLFTAEEARPSLPLAPALAEFAAIRDRLADRGTRLIVLPLPAKIDIHADHADNPALSARMAKLHDTLLAGLAREGIDTIDARPALRGAGFLQTDTHWSVEGAAAVAQAVADSGLIPMGTEPMQRHDAPEKEITGDLVSYVTTSDIAPLIGLARERLRPFTVAAPASPTADATDIFGAAETPLALVGTSYSANPDWSFPEALKLALGTDLVNHAAEGHGPVRPMRDFLETDAAPEILIWEFPVRYLTDPELWSVADDAT